MSVRNEVDAFNTAPSSNDHAKTWLFVPKNVFPRIFMQTHRVRNDAQGPEAGINGIDTMDTSVRCV